MKKSLSCFIVVLGILLLLLSGCATRDPSFDVGVNYGYDISGKDKDVTSLDGSFNQRIWKSEEGATEVRAGLGPSAMFVRTKREVDPAGGIRGEADVEFALNKKLAFVIGGEAGLFGMKSGPIGRTGFIGMGGVNLGLKWPGIKIAVILKHLSDIIDHKDEQINVAGVEVSTDAEVLWKLLKDAYYSVRGALFSSTKAPK